MLSRELLAIEEVEWKITKVYKEILLLRNYIGKLKHNNRKNKVNKNSYAYL